MSQDTQAAGNIIGTLLGGPEIGGSIGEKIGSFFGKGGMSTRKAAALQHRYWQDQVREELPLRVEGAKLAGLHPLAAIGVSSAAGGVSIPVGMSSGPDVSDMGQNISRAAQAYMSKNDRVKQDIADKLRLENASLQNDLLRSQISAINRPTTPGLNSGSVTGDVQFNPDEITSHLKGSPAYGAGANTPSPAVSTIRNRDGSITTVPSPAAKNAIEDSIIYETEHFLRNRVLPWFQDVGRDIQDGWKKSWYGR